MSNFYNYIVYDILQYIPKLVGVCMRILSITESNRNTSVQFKRKPTVKEFQFYTASINEGLKVLDKNIGMIIHNSCLPSAKAQNNGIGSLLSKLAEEIFIPFLKSHGISKIQQEPNYIRRFSDPSPYDPVSTSKNFYMAPLERLASPEYATLLSAATLGGILQRKQAENNEERVNYKNVAADYELAMQEAYTRMQMRVNPNLIDGTASVSDINKTKALAKDFEAFKAEKQTELEPNAMYEILIKKYNKEDWKKWDEADRNLYDSPNSKRLQELKEENKDEIDFYLFKQWITEREIAKTNERNKKLGISIVADTPIAFTPAEEWLNKDLFLEDFSLGCPPDYFSKDGQRWGFAVLNPKKIFNKDGSLGKGGEFLKKRYEEIFKASPGGVRIDHLIGLIDPFVYTESEPHMTATNSGRLYSSPHIGILSEYTKYTDDDFSAIFEKIIIPAAEKFGLSKSDIICEDLGDKTPPTKRVMEKLGLSGLSVTQFGYSGVDAPKENVIMLGAHDNKSYIEYTDELFGRAAGLGSGRDTFIYKTHILGSDTVVPGKDVNLYREELRRDKKKFMAASFAELFTSPAQKVQIFFTDFFGIGKTYNVPGTKKDCWTLRLPENWEELYYENLHNGFGVNLPEAIATAIRQKGEAFSAPHKSLLRKLDYFTKVLKE